MTLCAWKGRGHAFYPCDSRSNCLNVEMTYGGLRLPNDCRPGKSRRAHEPFAAPAGPIRNAQVLAKEYDHAGRNLSGATGDRAARRRAQGAAELERGPLRPLRVAARERARRGARLRRPVPRPGPAP